MASYERTPFPPAEWVGEQSAEKRLEGWERDPHSMLMTFLQASPEPCTTLLREYYDFVSLRNDGKRRGLIDVDDCCSWPLGALQLELVGHIEHRRNGSI